MARRFWRLETGLFLGIWLVLMASGQSRLFRDPGVFWHTVVGQQILADGRFPHTDPFSFTCSGEPWIARQWLVECLMALAHWIAGWDGLLLLTVTVLAALYTWAAHRLIRAGINGGTVVLLTVLAIAASSYHFHPRPHLATIVLLGCVFARLCDFEAKRITLRGLVVLVPLFLLWTNAHDGVVGGLATLALTAAAWSVLSACSRSQVPAPLPPRQIIPLALLVLACGGTVLLNPYGATLPQTWFSLLTSSVVPLVMDEHAPLLESSGTWPVVLLAVLYAAALVGVLPARPRATWLIPVVWFALAWTRVRHGPLFAITALIALADMLPHVRWVQWLDRRGSVLFHIEPPSTPTGVRHPIARSAPALLPAILVLSALILQTCGAAVPIIGRHWARLDSADWPVQLLPDLQRLEQERGSGTRLFNDMRFGGFLIYHTPKLRVFIDDRCELYGDTRLLEYVLALSQDPAQLDRWREQYGFDIALTAAGSNFDRYLANHADWFAIRTCPTATLYQWGRRKAKVDKSP